MLKHDFSETIAGLQEAINRGLDCLAEYGIEVGHRSQSRGYPHPIAHRDPLSSKEAACDKTAQTLAIAAGVTVGLAAGLILIGFLHSRRSQASKP